ncbi:GNAT family N-acetyltransferase [Phytomonospora sp. NPDC050363]|uniref:GNAT family N-acetyltransferase n=1 Tax=Phytomonospora sp. NPDC050363 TaxID=3155642 RepID=UPI0033E57F79
MTHTNVYTAGTELFAELGRVSAAAQELFASAGIHLPDDDPEATLRHASAVLAAGTPPVGFAALTLVDGGVHLEELAVDPAFGRRGVGSALLEGVCDYAREKGSAAVTLTTFRDVAFNGPFYASRGWREWPREEWGPQMREQWAAEEAAGIFVAPRIAMRRSL